jgi:hypothetical protein
LLYLPASATCGAGAPRSVIELIKFTAGCFVFGNLRHDYAISLGQRASGALCSVIELINFTARCFIFGNLRH